MTRVQLAHDGTGLWAVKMYKTLQKLGPSGAALTYSPDDAQALEADARCELARGHPRKALERLGQARVAAPGDERLREAESKLRATLPEFR